MELASLQYQTKLLAPKGHSSVLNLFSNLLVGSKYGQTSSSSLINDVGALF